MAASVFNLLIITINEKPTYQSCYDSFSCTKNFDWRKIYLWCCKTTINTKLRVLQYKILDHVLYLNKATFKNMLVCHHPIGSTRNVRVKFFLCSFLKKLFFSHKYIILFLVVCVVLTLLTHCILRRFH